MNIQLIASVLFIALSFFSFINGNSGIGVLSLLAGLLNHPALSEHIEKKLKLKLKSWQRYGVIALLLVLFFIFGFKQKSNIEEISSKNDHEGLSKISDFKEVIGLPVIKQFIKEDSVILKEQEKQQSIMLKEYEKEKAKEEKEWRNSKAFKIFQKHPEWSKEDCQKLADNKIWIGMTIEMLKYRRGNPNSATPSNYGSGNSWQWCWHDYQPSCFYDRNDDGIIDSYN